MNISEFLIKEIEERRRSGLEPDAIKLHPDDIQELKDEVNYIQRKNYAARDFDRFMGIPVVESEGVSRLDIDRQCPVCKSKKVYHDNREKWTCPFCEL